MRQDAPVDEELIECADLATFATDHYWDLSQTSPILLTIISRLLKNPCDIA